MKTYVIDAMMAAYNHAMIYGCKVIHKSEGDVHNGFTQTFDCPNHGLLSEFHIGWDDVADDIRATARIAVLERGAEGDATQNS